MLPGFTGYSTNYDSEILSRQGFGRGITHQKTQAISLAGGAGPGCEINCYCELFTYKCYERCDGRVVRAWDNGWCVSFGW